MRHIYLIPGLAASPGIFDFFEMPSDQFVVHNLTWELPLPQESLQAYCLRFKELITHENPILIGVSYGGIVAQELATMISVENIVIISSVKSINEFPRRIRYAKRFQLQKALPTFLVEHIEWLFKYNFGIGQKKLERYERYLHVRDKKYLDWAFNCIVNWKRKKPDPRVIHVHGEVDAVFPMRYISRCHVIPGASHAAIITHAKWINEHLPDLLRANT